MSLKGFFKECNDREVFKLLSIYVVSGWVLLQVISVVWEPLSLPEESVTFLIIFLLVGFPIYTLILWNVRVKIALCQDGEDIESNNLSQSTFKKMYFVSASIISMFSIVSAILIVNTNFLSKDILEISDLPILSNNDKLAVLNFENNTGDPKLDNIGKMVSDWLVHGITENRPGEEVISSELVSTYGSLLGLDTSLSSSLSVLDTYLKPSKVISGAYYLKDNSLLFNCSIQDTYGDKNMYSFEPIQCSKDDALQCIEDLKQVLLSYLFKSEGEELELEELPPKFDAYEKFIAAEKVYSNPNEYIKLLDEAIALDSTYFEPQVIRVQHYYNIGEFKISDSLNKLISTYKELSSRQSNLLSFCEALIDGKNDKIFRTLEYEYNLNPQDIGTNQTLMALMVQFINKPEDVEHIFPVIKINLNDLVNESSDKYIQSLYRYYIMGLAYNELGKYSKTVELLESIKDRADKDYLDRTLAAAYINLKDTVKLERMLTKLELLGNKTQNSNMNLFVAKQFILANDRPSAIKYVDKVINTSNLASVNLAEAYYYKEDFKNAKRIFTQLHKNEPNSIGTVSKLAVCYFKNQEFQKAESMIASLEDLRTDYQYGDIEYAYAQYYAATGNHDKAMNNLLKSVASGQLFTPDSFQNDVHFVDYKDFPKFKTVLNFWH